MDKGTDRNNRKSGFEDDTQSVWPCRHPEHDPPGHIVIPQGKIYRHICPGCGSEAVLRPPQTFMSSDRLSPRRSGPSGGGGN